MKIIILFIVLLVSGTITAAAGENLPTYNLSVSFDISKNLLTGVSTITLPEDMNISTGSLDITSIRLNGSPISPEIKDGVFRAKGTVEIFFQGRFGNENGSKNLENASGRNLRVVFSISDACLENIREKARTIGHLKKTRHSKF